MNSVLIIANREISTRIKSKAWIIATIISILLVCGVVAFYGLANSDAPSELINNNMSQSISELQQIHEEAQKQVFQQLGTSSDEFNNLVAQRASDIASARGVNNSNAMDNFWIGYIIAILMYMSIVMTSTQIAMGVAEEKTSSIAEVVIASTTTLKFFTGKILGVGIVGLLQIIVTIIPAAVVAKGLGMLNFSNFGASSHILLIIVMGIAFFLVGYTTYAALYAACASTVSRMEDVQSAIAPVTIFTIFGFMIAISGGGAGILATIVNYSPLLSPFAALSSFGKGELELWQIILSLVISIVFLPILIWLGSKIYSYSILKKGVKISPLAIFKHK